MRVTDPLRFALLGLVVQRSRTAAELAIAAGRPVADVERDLKALRRLQLVVAGMDRCPVCARPSGRHVWDATDAGQDLVAGVALGRQAA